MPSFSNTRTAAREFAARLPQEKYSVATLQGYLLQHKQSPESAVDNVVDWVSLRDGDVISFADVRFVVRVGPVQDLDDDATPPPRA